MSLVTVVYEAQLTSHMLFLWFSILFRSHRNLYHAMGLQTGSSVDGSYSLPLIFAKLPEVNQEGSQWTECEMRDAINLIYENLQRLDTYVSVLVRIFHYMILINGHLVFTPFIYVHYVQLRSFFKLTKFSAGLRLVFKWYV